LQKKAAPKKKIEQARLPAKVAEIVNHFCRAARGRGWAIGFGVNVRAPGIKKEKRMQHSPQFLKLVSDAKKRVKETTVADVQRRMDSGENFLLVDVREDNEWEKGHIPGAVHMGKGIIERDIEIKVPQTDTKVILYCGGGFRSALVADNLQKMGYTNVESMDGGWRGWTGAGLPAAKD
jgi:rhodanese-related sulfurtransferase